jgi:hypothetical protein
MHTRTVDLIVENLLEITEKFEAFFHLCHKTIRAQHSFGNGDSN